MKKKWWTPPRRCRKTSSISRQPDRANSRACAHSPCRSSTSPSRIILIGAAILQEKPPVAIKGESGPANITSRADILKFLKDSFAYAHKALASINENNILEPIKSPFGDHPTTRLALATSMLSHPFDHYGQMVEYLRMNGIIPPASRK